MVKLTRGSRLYICKYHNITCYRCKVPLEGKYAVSRPRSKQFCLHCAIELSFISKPELRKMKIPLEAIQ